MKQFQLQSGFIETASECQYSVALTKMARCYMGLGMYEDSLELANQALHY